MREVGLIAKGEGWDLSLNYPDMELWGVNDSIFRDENIDLCFFMDREIFLNYDFSTHEGRKSFQKEVGLPPDAVEEINNSVTKICNERNLPLYCTKKFDDIPSSMAYPIEDIQAYFGTDYFGNSLDYMIALAIYKGFDVIHTFGLNMSQGSKYIYEKPSTTFWLGVALGKGIELHLHGEECNLLTTMDGKTYAYKEIQVRGQGRIKIDETPLSKITFNENKTVFLSSLDRMLIVHHLPKASRYKTMIEIDAFKKELSFTLDEEKAVALHTDGTGTSIKFIEEGIPPKEFELSPTILKVIKRIFKKLDEEGKIDMQLGKLYERFVLGE